MCVAIGIQLQQPVAVVCLREQRTVEDLVVGNVTIQIFAVIRIDCNQGGAIKPVYVTLF